MPFQLRTGLLAGALCGVLALAGCGTSTADSGPASSGGTADGKITVVASTNVYGNIAEVVGGDAVQVTSIVSNPGQDPHSYEGNPQVTLQLSKAALVIENGGGYDDFVDTMLEAGQGNPVVLNAVEVSGLQAAEGEELNEHVWYHLPSAQRLADRVAAELGRAAPDRAATFTANAERFRTELDTVIASEARVKSRHQGEGVAITEPVPVYLLEAMGLVDKTPAEFSEAVEEGEDVSAAVLKEALDLYADDQVAALVYNEQTSGPVTEQVKAAAERAGTPVVPVTETLPEGETYVSWMTSNVSRVGAALDRP